jgi:hypothetical protein
MNLFGIFMDTIFELKGYENNRDYERLADIMQTQSVVCIVDYMKDCRDVAHTIWSPSEDGRGIWQLSARGIGYVYAWGREDFICKCRHLNVDIIFPNAEPCHE